MSKIVVTFIVVIGLFSVGLIGEGPASDKEAIQKVIKDAYIDGLCNTGNIEKIKKGFHPGFNLLGVRGNVLNPLPIYNWIEYIKMDKEKGKFPKKDPVSVKFLFVDVTGNAAVAKIAYIQKEKQIYTDYLSLYKFKEGWRLVNKIYYKHPQK
jgi:hypothetical protein